MRIKTLVCPILSATTLFIILLFFRCDTVDAQERCCCCYIPPPFCSGGDCCSSYTCGTPGQCPCNGGGGGCFTGETKIATPGGDPSAGSGQEKEIKDIKQGDVVRSFDSETGEIKQSTVSAIHKTTTPGYWLLKTESGKEIKVTGEHPVLAVQRNDQITSTESQTNSKSQILNRKLKALFSSLMAFVGKIF